MKKRLIDRLCLGTVQFGLDYGIANRKGKIPKEEAFKILEYAHSAGIDTVDTAYSYGESERIIGEFISRSGRAFKVISKMPGLEGGNTLKAERYLLKTLENLKQAKIYGYLVHKFDNMISHKEDLYAKFKSLKEEGLVEQIGVSIYKPRDLDYLLDKRISFDIIQLPYNIFDQRFKEYLPILKKRDIRVYARSVFLQGLFFAEMDRIEKDFQSAKYLIKRLYSISEDYGIPLYSLCLCFILLDPLIDKIVIGVDSLTQLKENIDSLGYIDKVKDIQKLLKSLKFHDEEIILPFNWKR